MMLRFPLLRIGCSSGTKAGTGPPIKGLSQKGAKATVIAGFVVESPAALAQSTPPGLRPAVAIRPPLSSDRSASEFDIASLQTVSNLGPVATLITREDPGGE